MKDNNQQNQRPDNLSPEEAMQETLCSYLFGELDATERAHVEERMKESAAWREEHARLSQTAQMVQSTLGDSADGDAGAGDALSAASMKTLYDEARKQSPVSNNGSVHQISAWRKFAPVAASLAVVFGGVFAWKAMESKGDAPEYRDNTVAQEAGKSSGWGADRYELEPQDLAAEEPKEQASHAPDAEVLDEAGWPNDPVLIRGDQSPTSSEEMLDKYAEVNGEIKKKNLGSYGGRAAAPNDSAGPQNELDGVALETSKLGEGLAYKNEQEIHLARERAAGTDGSFVGTLTNRGSAPATDTATPATGHGGNYRGPLDVAPPGGAQAKLLQERGGARQARKELGARIPTGAEPSFEVAPVTAPDAAAPGLVSPDRSQAKAPKQSDGSATAGSPKANPKGVSSAPGTPAPGSPLSKPKEDSGRFDGDAEDGDFGDGLDKLGWSKSRSKLKRNSDRFPEQKEQAPAETPAQLELRLRYEMEARAAERSKVILHNCLPRPNEAPRDMYYRWWGDNAFTYASTDPLATFAADVDTASYTLARNYLVQGNLPTKAQIRTEEFVNYFAGDIPAPTEGLFNVQTEATLSPFGGSSNRYMLRVGIRGKDIPKAERPPMSLVYVVDVSGSMKQGNRMELVKHSLRLLGTELDGRDTVGIVSFSDTAKLVMPMTSMENRATLETSIQALKPDGSTNVEDGMRLGYELLARESGEGRLRRVVLISDGVANTGNTTADTILAQVDSHRKSGIYLSTVGVGMGNHNDALLERLANRGDGVCDYVDDEAAARRAMVDRFAGGFIPIARDLKIQVEFDKKYVVRYRQIGYENRAVADQDFRNDAIDGGEVGSGHQVTALFELDCTMPESMDNALVLGQVRLRYKSIATGAAEKVSETEHAVTGIQWEKPVEAGTPGFQRALVAAQFAEVLRHSTHAAGDDIAALEALANKVADLPAFAGDADTRELGSMIKRARGLGAGKRRALTELDRTVDQYRKHRYLNEVERRLRGQQTSDRLQEIERLNAELERRIQELCLQEAKAGR